MIDQLPQQGVSHDTPVEPLFENLPELIRPEVAASTLGLNVRTIYGWHYKRKFDKVPATLFLKVNRLLYVRTDALRRWIRSQNSSDL